MTRTVLALCLALTGALGCSSTHLGVDEDTGPIVLMTDAGAADARGTASPDAPSPPGVDAWSPVATDPDAWTPPMMGGPDAWSPPMSGEDAGPPGVTCGTEVCVDPQICCIAFGGPGGGGMSSMTCSAPADCMGVAASCDGPEDCAAGEACCGMRGAGGGGSTACVPDAMCGFGRLCHVDADCTGRDTCCAFMGASVCSPFCP